MPGGRGHGRGGRDAGGKRRAGGAGGMVRGADPLPGHRPSRPRLRALGRRGGLNAGDGAGTGGRPGPFIVEEMDCTVVVPPGWRGRLDERGFILMTRSD